MPRPDPPGGSPAKVDLRDATALDRGGGQHAALVVDEVVAAAGDRTVDGDDRRPPAERAFPDPGVGAVLVRARRAEVELAADALGAEVDDQRADVPADVDHDRPARRRRLTGGPADVVVVVRGHAADAEVLGG